MVVLIAAVTLPGCGERDRVGAASREPQQVARQFAMFYAKLAANEDHPASQAQVQALAKQLAPTCAPPRFGQYACVVHLPGRDPPTQRCVAIVTSSGSVTGRCSAGLSPAPVVATGYVDCTTVGHVVSITDPPGDEQRVVPRLRSARLVPGTDPHADLVEVRIAASPSRFCADFRTRSPLTPGTWLGLAVSQNRGPDLEFAPTINYSRSPTPELQSPVGTPAAGQIGTSGDWTSLVIAAGDPSRPLPRQPFQFRAHANHETTTPGIVRATTDTAPNRPGYATYP